MAQDMEEDGAGGQPEAEDLGAGSLTFSIDDEDHTLANALRFFLNKKCVRPAAPVACTAPPARTCMHGQPPRGVRPSWAPGCRHLASVPQRAHCSFRCTLC